MEEYGLKMIDEFNFKSTGNNVIPIQADSFCPPMDVLGYAWIAANSPGFLVTNLSLFPLKPMELRDNTYSVVTVSS